MPTPSPAGWLAIVLVAAAAISAVDLQRVEEGTLVIYTTPAIKDLLETAIVPPFEAQSGLSVKLVYLPAGDEYYRVLMTRERPEADLFLHASPLFIEKGYAEGIFAAYPAPVRAQGDGTPQRATREGNVWTAFATSPLVAVHAPTITAPDLNRSSLRFGLPHPLLSNNGMYAALLFDQASPAAGRKAVDLTVVQPTNAQANINGAADGSFDLTLGYEAVARLFQTKGADITFSLPVVDGVTVTTDVLFCVGLVKNQARAGAQDFIAHLFTPEVQDALAQHTLRPTVANHTQDRKSVV